MNSLVSVIVVTYNSAAFVEETLNSVAAQTWKEIELIITDDFSKDNTIEICEAWLTKNESRFFRTLLITSERNTGTTANANRGLAAATGEWIKNCAGDDALMPNCLEDNMLFVSSHPETKALFSYCRMYKGELTEDCFIGLNPKIYPRHIINEEISAQDQYKLLLVSNRIPFTPSIFLNHSTRLEKALLDEKYPFSDDYQLFLSLTKNGVKLCFMEKETMKYRMHDNSLSKQVQEYIVHPMYYRNEPIMMEYSYPFLPWDLKYSKLHNWYVNKIFKIELLNRRNKFNLLLHYVLTVILNPFQYLVYFKTHFSKKHRGDYFYK